MATDDTCCTIAPYFNVHDGKLDAFRALCERFVDTTRTEEKCLYYGFSFAGNEVHCREAYTDAKGLLAHVKHVGPLLEESLTLADLSRLEIHGPEQELEVLRRELADLNPQFFVLQYGFRK
jgi:hypothetical protein